MSSAQNLYKVSPIPMLSPRPWRKAKKSAVLFICRMNVIRSPMAAALTQAAFDKNLLADSAGIDLGVSDPFVITVMREIGIDLSDHNPKTLDSVALTSFDLLVTLAPEAHHHFFNLYQPENHQILYWPMPDPSSIEGSRSQILEAYRTLRTLLQKKIKTDLSNFITAL